MKQRKNDHGSQGQVESAEQRKARDERIMRRVERDVNAFLNANPALRDKVMASLLGKSEKSD